MYADTSDSHRSSSRRVLKPGEWACTDVKCGNVNTDKRDRCDACGKTKPKPKNKAGVELGKDAAEKSKGLFSAEDWMCTKCGNVNWARRNVCNLCNAKKLADLEVRTGFGGGYNDRQDIEYVRRGDTNEEFDEFGRKKKSKRDDDYGGAYDDDEHSATASAAARDTFMRGDDELNREDVEDEGEDNEDDADLDKYDLTADTDVKFSFNLDKLKKKDDANEASDTPSGNVSSDCSCSCSGGECSCDDADSARPKRPRDEESRGYERERERRRSTERSRRGGGGDKDDKQRVRSSRERDYDGGGSRNRRRSRERERTRH